MQPCLFCSGDASEPGHLDRCDGRQGVIEGAFNPRNAFAAPTESDIITRPRDTSVRAFYQAVDAGVIATRRQQVWSGLRAIGIATSSEVFEYLKEKKHLGLRYDSNTCARFTELRDLGLIREVGERQCRVTGQTCITWAVVLSLDYAGTAIVHRCSQCGQIVAREIPRPTRRTG